MPAKKIAFAAVSVFAVSMFASCLASFNPTSAECITLRLAERLRLPYRFAELAGRSEGDRLNDFPKDLQTDLKGGTITIALPENAPDVRWDDELIAKFHELTGIRAETIRPGNDTTVVLSRYLTEFQNGSLRRRPLQTLMKTCCGIFLRSVATPSDMATLPRN